MSFYRKYRPQVIKELDSTAIREQLLTFLKKEKKDLPHAYFFSGSRGTGKTTAARILAKLFNCTKPLKDGEPCGKCGLCQEIAQGSSIDVLEIDAASNTGVDNIRDLRDKIILAPSIAKYKVYIIDEVHMLSGGAFNALLKTLEEPPPHAIFILATTDPHKVPDTIKSRCVNFVFSKPGQKELVASLGRAIKEEKISIDEEALELIARYADGSFRDAVKLLEQASFQKGKITEAVVRKTLSLTDKEHINIFFDSLSRFETRSALQVIKNVIKDGLDIRVFITQCLERLEEMLISFVEGDLPKMLENDSVKDLIRRFEQAYVEMKTSPIAELPLELAIVEFCESTHFPKKEEKALPEIIKEKEEKISDSPVVKCSLLTLEKLEEHWKDFIEEVKPFNHSVAAVLRSCHPKSVSKNIVTLQTQYAFHKEKLSDARVRETLAKILKKLFGEETKVEIILVKK